MSHNAPPLASTLAIALLFSAPTIQAQTPEPGATVHADPALLTAEAMPRARHSLLLDAVVAEGRTVVVGERGHILINGEAQWRQVEDVPTRSTLTAVTAVGPLLWAVGHDGVILHSPDGGRRWERQRAEPWQPGVFDPSIGVPLLDVLFLDPQRGFAVGAYSLLLETTDGGATWQARLLSEEATDAFPEEDEPAAAPVPAPDDDAAWVFSDEELMLEEEADPHLNAIARTGSGALVIAGERGTVFRSRDEGRTWERLRLPYGGSMFGAFGFSGDHVLLYGLRGNVFESMDLGDTWTAVTTGTESSLMGGYALPHGGAVLVGSEGVVLRRERADAPFALSVFVNAAGETPVLAGILPQDDGSAFVFGDRGVERAGAAAR